ncbi:MAG: flagellar biosynthesis anti-sigma factor FlgM [Gallionella sp.]
MKIDKPGKPAPATRVGGTSAHTPSLGKSGGKSAKAGNTTDSTSVSIGSTTMQLNSLAGNISDTPVVDAGKVAEIKEAISEGRFKVNSGVVADKLIETVRELINDKK